jgi:hypothetical protein
VPNYRISKAFLTLLVAVEGCLKNAWFGALNETLSALVLFFFSQVG